MRHAPRTSALLLCVSMTAACATGAGSAADTARFERDVGTGSAADVMEKTQKVLRQHQFEVRERTEPPNIFIETHWRDRAPFEDEAALGIRAAQSRIVVRARARGNTPLGELYAVNVAIETRVLPAGSTEWSPNTATEQYRRWADGITADFRRELNVGVRRF